MPKAVRDRRFRSNTSTRRLLADRGRALCESLEERRLLATFVVDSLETGDDGDRSAGDFALIEAVADANANPGPDDIVFSDSLIGQQLDIPAALNISSDTTVTGPSSGVFTISGQDTSRIFDITGGSGVDVVISRLTLTNGGTAGNGGAIISSVGLQLVDVIIENSSAAQGGGVYVLNGSLTTDAGTIIRSNNATDSGGGIYATSGTLLTINGSTIDLNTSDGSGGGIGSGNAQSITITGATISGNQATDNGGGVLASIQAGGDLAITSTTFSMNSASDAGGLDLSMNASGTSAINGGSFTGNTVTGSGGGLRATSSGGTIDITGTAFTSNSAGQDGGALQSLAQTLTINGASFSMNDAAQGGAIGTTQATGGTIHIEDSTISGNTAVDNGGGIYIRKPFATSSADPTVRIVSSTISENSATAGAGLYVSGDENTEIVIEDSMVMMNTANTNGGGILLTGVFDESTFSLAVSGSTISGNRANTLDGGGIFSTAGVLSINDSTITGNTAARDGGGIHDASLLSEVTNSTLSDNTATVRGGGFYKSRSGSSARFTSSLLSGNSASTSDGGGLYFSGFEVRLTNATLSGNSAESGGGAAASSSSLVTIRNSTITANTASNEFGGVASSSGTSLTISSSIIAANTDADGVDENLNILDVTSSTSNLFDTDPGLTELGDFGGPTLTHVPTEGSPALDAGVNGAGLSSDARGFARDDGNGLDIGATEAFRPEVTLGSEAISIANRAVVISVTSANDVDGFVEGINVYRDVNNNGTPDDGEFVQTVSLGGSVALPVETLPVGSSNLLLVGVDNTGLLGAITTAEVTLDAIPGFSTVTVLDAGGAATTSLERDSAFTINVEAPIVADAAGSITGFEVYADTNSNGQADPGELLSTGVFSEDATTGTGTVTVSREESRGLPLGTTTLLVVPLTSRSGDEASGTPSPVNVSVSAARTVGADSEVSAASSSDLHRVVGVAGDGSPLLFSQQTDGSWSVQRLDDASGISTTFGSEVEVWTNAAGLTRAAVLSGTSIVVFIEQTDGSFIANDLGATVAGSAPIVRAMTRFTTPDGRVYLAGYSATDRLVAFHQASADSTDWQFDDISADLEGRGLTTPVLDEIVSYVTSWNQWSIVGIDANGDIQNVWVLPGTFEEWTLNNLSQITNAPSLASGLSVILTGWSGINLTALDASGELRVTWWVPSFQGDWVSSNLSEIADASGEVDDRVIVEVMTGYITSWSGMNYAGVNAEGDLIIYWWVPAFGGQWLVSQITDGADGDAYEPMADISSYVSPEGTLNVVGSDGEGDVLRSSWRPGDSAWATEALSDIAAFV